jgi:hypothetical protein
LKFDTFTYMSKNHAPVKAQQGSDSTSPIHS